MGRKFLDYYEVCGLDSNKSREDNYKDLLKLHHEVGRKRGQDAELELLQLNKAMSIFNDMSRYQEFRSEWEQRRQRGNKAAEQQRSQEGVGEQQARAAAEKARREAEKTKPSFLRSLFNKGRCVAGVHKGEWFYDFPDECVQIQICELCDSKNVRTEHRWPEWTYQTPGKCQRVRVCNRCSEYEYDVEHNWIRWEYVAPSVCTQVQICGGGGRSV